MKLSVSNIAWTADMDEKVYGLMKKYGFQALEIAPTRIFAEAPYEKIKETGEWKERLRQKYGFSISSMQSVWYGRREKLFGTEKEREVLLDYTKKAIIFAEAAGCGNLVFGCPKNRSIPEGADRETGIRFFRELGAYAVLHGAVIGMEANPVCYNTNYINTTREALELIKATGSEGFRLNLDTGTMLYNEEAVSVLEGYAGYISHVHISEPYLKPVKKRAFHKELKQLLAEARYDGWVSLEMARTEEISELEEAMAYVQEVFLE